MSIIRGSFGDEMRRIFINTEQVRYIEQIDRREIDDYGEYRFLFEYRVIFGGDTQSRSEVLLDETSGQKLLKYLEFV